MPTDWMGRGGHAQSCGVDQGRNRDARSRDSSQPFEREGAGDESYGESFKQIHCPSVILDAARTDHLRGPPTNLRRITNRTIGENPSAKSDWRIPTRFAIHSCRETDIPCSINSTRPYLQRIPNAREIAVAPSDGERLARDLRLDLLPPCHRVRAAAECLHAEGGPSALRKVYSKAAIMRVQRVARSEESSVTVIKVTATIVRAEEALANAGDRRLSARRACGMAKRTAPKSLWRSAGEAKQKLRVQITRPQRYGERLEDFAKYKSNRGSQWIRGRYGSWDVHVRFGIAPQLPAVESTPGDAMNERDPLGIA
ncbi:hypothetical protein DFH09DRAFT_1073077 [Mycena vulgaris]|nr:hypothetical protein DFH09DRAFT_1073077 [Mycena vulgaris]